MTPTPGMPLNLAPLYRERLLRSTSPQASHARVTQELSDHTLSWKRGPVDTVMFRARTRQLDLFMLRYGAEVEIRPQLFQGFALMHYALKGVAEFECDGHRMTTTQGRAAFIAPRRELRMHWQQGAEQIILKIPYALLPVNLDQNAASSALLPAANQEQWVALLQALLQATALPADTPARSAWLDHFERSVALFATMHHGGAAHEPHPTRQERHAREEEREAQTGQDNASRRLDALQAYMRAHLTAPVALPDLARAVGVSARTLGTLCLKHHGLTPMDLLRNQRLDAVRARLRARPDANITATAFEFGFGHLGRFSAYYRARFGELPSQTVGQ